jgi:hypothetical protein
MKDGLTVPNFTAHIVLIVQLLEVKEISQHLFV